MRYVDRVNETTRTTGVGPLTLAGAVGGFRSFASALNSGDEVTYTVVSATQFEVGRGIFTAPATLSRAEVIASSTGALVNLDPGAKQVFITQSAGDVVLRSEVPLTSAREQSTWYINAATGNDDADGSTVGTALATQAEWARRVGEKPLVPMSITFLTDTSEAMTWNVSNAFTELVTVYGGLSAPLFSGTIASAQNYTPASGLDGRFTDASIPVSWTASGLVGKRYLLTSGAHSGKASWITSDLGSKTARIAFTADRSGDFVSGSIANGDTYSIHNLIKLTGNQTFILKGHGSGIHFRDLEIGVEGGPSHQHRANEGEPWFLGCKLHGFDAKNVARIYPYGSWIANLSRTRIYEMAEIIAYACHFPQGVTVHQTGQLYAERCTSHGPIVLEKPGGRLQVISSLGIFDTPTAVTMGSMTMANLIGRLWGTGVTTTGIQMGSGARVVYAAANPISIATPATQVSVSGTAKLYSELPYVHAATQSFVVQAT